MNRLLFLTSIILFVILHLSLFYWICFGIGLLILTDFYNYHNVTISGLTNIITYFIIFIFIILSNYMMFNIVKNRIAKIINFILAIIPFFIAILIFLIHYYTVIWY